MFDIETLDESAREGVRALIDSKVSEEVKGLKSKNEELLGKNKGITQSLTELQEFKTKYEVLGDNDPAAIANMLKGIEDGKISEAMKSIGVTDDQLAPILGAKLESERKKWKTESDAAINALSSERDELAKVKTALTESVKQMRLDEVAKASFRGLSDAESGNADAVVAEQVRKVFTLDEDGKAVALDSDGEVILDAKKQPLTIETYINENLRQDMGFLFVAPEGGKGKGGRGSPSSGFGTGIVDRSKSDPATISTFMNAAREAGKTDAEAQMAWQALPSGK